MKRILVLGCNDVFIKMNYDPELRSHGFSKKNPKQTVGRLMSKDCQSDDQRLSSSAEADATIMLGAPPLL